MSELRSECHIVTDGRHALPDDTALFLIRDSVAQRRSLLFGRLHYQGQHCAIGCFFADHPTLLLNSSLIDEVAAVNDSVPNTAMPRERWKKVNSWLRWKVRILAGRQR